MKLFLLFSLISLAYADSDPSDLIEKTFPRDNTFCTIKKSRVEFTLRGEVKNVEVKERRFGEYAFVMPDEKPASLPLNKSRLDTYKFFTGKSPLCDKGMAYLASPDTFAILFLKENRPYHEKLTIQLVDANKFSPKEAIETDYLVDKAEILNGKLVFKTLPERSEVSMGMVVIDGHKFTYQDRIFPIWISYDLKTFEIQSSFSYQKFPWKKHFKSEADFLEAASWDAKDKKFKESTFYLAVNHITKKECVLFTTSKEKLTGTEAWRCYQKI